MILAIKIFILLFACIWLMAMLLSDVEDDYEKWIKNIDVQHTKEGWQRVALLSPVVIFLMLATLNEIASLKIMVKQLIIPGIISGFLLFFFYWLFFDGLYNRKRKLGWFFAGSNDGKKKDSKLDRFLMPKPTWLRAAIKIGGLLLFLILYAIKFLP